jgi:hypothetical protein
MGPPDVPGDCGGVQASDHPNGFTVKGRTVLPQQRDGLLVLSVEQQLAGVPQQLQVVAHRGPLLASPSRVI